MIVLKKKTRVLRRLPQVIARWKLEIACLRARVIANLKLRALISKNSADIRKDIDAEELALFSELFVIVRDLALLSSYLGVDKKEGKLMVNAI